MKRDVDRGELTGLEERLKVFLDRGNVREVSVEQIGFLVVSTWPVCHCKIKVV